MDGSYDATDVSLMIRQLGYSVGPVPTFYGGL